MASIFEKILKLFPKEKESAFREGLVIKMCPGYHTTKPYYVEVLFYDIKAKVNGGIRMVTSIPGEHECKMTIGSNWEYHYRRMSIMGDKSKFGHLLLNQKLD